MLTVVFLIKSYLLALTDGITFLKIFAASLNTGRIGMRPVKGSLQMNCRVHV
jgi:hypothetical protein